MNVLRFPIPSAAIAVATPAPVDPAVAAFQVRCFDAYRNRRTNRNLNPDYVEKCIGSVLDLLRWSGQTLTSVTEADYEAWTTHLALLEFCIAYEGAQERTSPWIRPSPS
ncbi:MAG TPA: hypothetical protein VMR06_14325 [Dokdonella sp.]|uniref:hypothetical protein n=1 Tax=Dokdonella sp. TaxID=2291710 RepID=UPI002CBA5607|nr:hypothetical protein [Dokdonella sp.]HUD43163.1 hypothetical protein [Dokdonella sp.]